MILDDNGLRMASFEPTLASVLGNTAGEPGAKILSEAGSHQHKRVELRDWLYVLLKSPANNALRGEYNDRLRLDMALLIENIEGSYDIEDADKGMGPSDLLSTTVTPEVLKMLEHAETLARDHQCPNVSELEVTLALIECADETLLDLLKVTSKEEAFEHFVKSLLRKIKERIAPPVKFELFDMQDKLRKELFSADGRSFCKRLCEDMAAIGIKSTPIATHHLLYSILGNTSGPLVAALAASGVNVKDMHAVLSRQLSRVGNKRNDKFELIKTTVLGTVVSVFKAANELARRREAKGISENDILRAFVEKEFRELIRLLPRADAISQATLASYLEDSRNDEEESAPIQRFTLKELQENINKAICGQQPAVTLILPSISALRFGMVDEGKPAGVFLFLGPTGTGKTQLGKELARYVYGNEAELLFFEMGQFNTKESMNTFIGAPAGYQGYGAGQLTNGLRDHPECVVLFDEIEKADTSVFNALLRFVDEGVISDPAGPVRDGRKCIIVMTSNAGQAWLRKHVKQHPEARENPDLLSDQLKEEALKELFAKGFKPEFMARVDKSITFVPFSRATCRQIVDGVLKKTLLKFEEKGVVIEIPDDVRDLLAKCTFDTAMDEGARGAPRAVKTYITSPAIDLLTLYSERGEELPGTLRAVLLGNGTDIEWEVEL